MNHEPQSDVNNEKKGVRKKFEGNVLAASTRLTEQMNERINSLETHLQKYGYVKPSGWFIMTATAD